MDEQQSKRSQTSWHELLGALLIYLLKPLGIEVTIGFLATKEIPKGDILLLRTETKQWSDEQYAVLPDGIRDHEARRVLIEFKYTESINRKAFLQILGYDTFYRRSHTDVKVDDIQSFLVSSKTPVNDTLNAFGYTLGDYPGVYHSDQILLKDITLLVLNDLRDEPHNAFFKCFASKRKRKKMAFDLLKQGGWLRPRSRLGQFLQGLQFKWFSKQQEDQVMTMIAPSKEEILEIGKMWEESYFDALTLDTFLAKKRVSTEEVLSRYKPEEVLTRYGPEQRLAGLGPEQRLAGLGPEQRLAGLGPEELLANVTPEEIERYLKQLKAKQQDSSSKISSDTESDLL